MLLLFPETPVLPHLAEEQTATQTQPEHPGSWKPHRCLRRRISSNAQSLSGSWRGRLWWFFVVVVYFIKFFPFLFLLILMDNIPSCPGLCQVGRCPCPPQTSGCLFGSSLEPSLKAGPCCQHLPSDFFFLTFFRVYRNVLQRIRSALSCVSFCFLPLLKNQFLRKGRSCPMCAAHGADSM